MAPPANLTYLGHFGLQSEPFSNAPVTRLYYESEQHKQALQRLIFALDSMKGLAVVVGDIGTGKSTLARRLLDALPEHEYEAALLVIIHAGVDASWLLSRIAMQLGVVDPVEDKLALIAQLYQRLVQIYESDKKAVVLIDEVQMLDTRELMEEFRGLLNLEVPERKLLSFVFFGLPEIDRVMKLDPPLRQRVALKFALQGLSRDAMEQYILHRLKLAGAHHPIFTAAALDLVYRSTGGVPRVINTICDNALLEGFLAGRKTIDADIIRQVSENLGFDDPRYEAPEQVDASAPPVVSAPPPARTAPPIVTAPTRSAPEPILPQEDADAEPAFGKLMDNFTPSAQHAPVTRTAPTPAPAATRTPAPAAPAAPAAKPTGRRVNLEEIDSLLAQIRKT